MSNPHHPFSTSHSANLKQITRSRASYSCQACKRRKVKCNKIHPVCGNCVRAGEECIYDSKAKLHATNSFSGHASGPQTEHRPATSEYGQSGLKRRRTLDKSGVGNWLGTPWASGDDASADTSVKGSSRAATLPRSASREIESRLDRLTSMVEQLSSNKPRNDERDSSASPPSTAQGWPRRTASTSHLDVEPRPFQQERSNSYQRVERLGNSEDEEETENLARDTQRRDSLASLGDLTLGHLSLEAGGRSKYVGTTYWASIGNQISELNQLLLDQNRYDIPKSSADNGETNSVCEDSRQSSPLGEAQIDMLDKSVLFRTVNSPPPSRYVRIYEQILKGLPTRRQSDMLYRHYVSGIHPLIPMLHLPTTLKWYEGFWEWYENRAEVEDIWGSPNRIPLLYAILYGGSVSCSEKVIQQEFKNTSKSSLSIRLHDEVTRSLSLLSFPRSPSLPALTAFCIVQTIPMIEEEPVITNAFISMALRSAMTMGLHREPSRFGLHPEGAELRRRIWWHLLLVDSFVSVGTGLPPILSSDIFWDVNSLSELKDDLIGTERGEMYVQAVCNGDRQPDMPDACKNEGELSSCVDVKYVVAHAKYSIVLILRKVLRIQLGVKQIGRKALETLRELLREAESIINNALKRITYLGDFIAHLSPAERERRRPDHVPSSAAMVPQDYFQAWKKFIPQEGLDERSEQYHRVTLMSFHKWARILLGMFLDKTYCIVYQPFLKNASSKLWAHVRENALEHCHGFIIKFLQLSSDPAFQPFQWAWPGLHQPMHAVMIMLVDLNERPHSKEAARSRSLIDRVWVLSDSDSRIFLGQDCVPTPRPLRECGRESWEMLRRLRQSAWQKAGLDPDMIWIDKDGEKHMPSAVDEAFQVSSEVGTTAREEKEKQQRTLVFDGLIKAARADAATGAFSEGLNPPKPSVSFLPWSEKDEEANPRDQEIQSHPSRLVAHASLDQINTEPVKASLVPAPLETHQSTFASYPSTTIEGLSPSTGFNGSRDFDWDQWDAVFGMYTPIEENLMDVDEEHISRLGGH